MTKELEEAFAKMGSQENAKDPIVLAHFFFPAGSGDWYPTEMWYHIRYAKNTPTQMQGLPKYSSRGEDGAVQNLREQNNSKNTTEELSQGGRAPQLQGVGDGQWIHDDLQAGAPNGAQEPCQTRDVGIRGEDRAFSEKKRSRSSQERDSFRRSPEEPPVDDKNGTSQFSYEEDFFEEVEVEASELKKYANAEILDIFFFGYANILEGEWGSFSLKELEAYRSKRFMLGIERDKHWKPIPFSQVKKL